MNGPVSEIIRDDKGNEAVEELLLGVADTGFKQDVVRRILSHDRVPEDWRVGEALAECYIRDHRQCTFPWPAARDQKNPESSPTGADLVGFQKTNPGEANSRFAFGEVKTSTEHRWPPQVMFGRHGMVRQLEALRDNPDTKDHLVKYLGHRVTNAKWKKQYIQSTARYLANPADVSLFGVLVRDVEPKEADLSSRAKALATNCPRSTAIELIAAYLPVGSISGIGKRVKPKKEGRHAGEGHRIAGPLHAPGCSSRYL